VSTELRRLAAEHAAQGWALLEDGTAGTVPALRHLQAAIDLMTKGKIDVRLDGGADERKPRRKTGGRAQRPVERVDPATGKAVGTWPSIREASEAAGCSEQTIRNVIAGRQAAGAGYGWRFAGAGGSEAAA
jgi:hypothetical protein